MANENENYLQALAYAAARFQVETEKALRNYFAQSAPVTSLENLGRDRLITRYPQETDDNAFRTRVVNAWDENVGRGNWPDMVRVVEGYGFTFAGEPDGFVSGFTGGDPYEAFNIIINTLGGGSVYDGVSIYNGAILYDSIGPNEVSIEIKRHIGDPLTDALKQEIITDLFNVIRASIRNIYILEIFV